MNGCRKRLGYAASAAPFACRGLGGAPVPIVNAAAVLARSLVLLLIREANILTAVTQEMTGPTVFISYAREDSESARRLHNDLSQAGFTPWLDEESLLPGQKWELAVRKAISTSRFFVAMISVNSTRESKYVQREFEYALEVLGEYPDSEIYVIPVRLDRSEPPQERLRERHWADLFPDWKRGFEKVLLSLRIDTTLVQSGNLSGLPKEWALLLTRMKKLDRDIVNAKKCGRQVRQLFDRRGWMFDGLREEIDRSAHRAREIIDSIGR
jgi:hypothetical protein